jgi:predicted  nucleic acid-binding Zn-ribbon protein
VTEEALDELDRVQTQTAGQVAACQAATEQAQAGELAAQAEVEKVRTEAARAAARAQAATEQLTATHERILTERTADLQRQLEQISADAQEQIKAMRDELAAATSAAARAEAERAASAQTAERERATVTQLRAQLDTERGDHLHQLAEARREAHDERVALTHTHGEQLAAVIAAIGQGGGQPDVAPARATSTRRPRGKEQGS